MTKPKPKRKPESRWPKSWAVPDGAAAILFNADGSVVAHIPKQSEYAMESPPMMAMIAMIVTSPKMTTWRKRFLKKQFKMARDE